MPFAQAGGQLLFHLISRLYERTSIIVNTNLPRVPVDDGINAVRLILPTCRFDKDRCKAGLESPRQYRREYDEDKRTFKPAPLHDFTSNDADAFRYLAMGLESDAGVPPDIPRYSGRRRWSGACIAG